VPALNDILKEVRMTSISGSSEADIKQVDFDSRKVVQGSVFVAVKGTRSDGHTYIDKAIKSGAKAVVCERIPVKTKPDITYIAVKNSARALGIMASNFYGNPSRKLILIGVTGTNGKTSVTTILYDLFRNFDYGVGLISTVDIKINDQVYEAEYTTPDTLQINQLLLEMLDKGCTHCFMEASSHAIEQERVAGLKFTGVVFTNVSHDHLDYHQTFDAYIKAKKKIFDDLPSSAFALANADDRRGKIVLQNTKGLKSTFSLKNPSEFKGKIISNTIQGLELEIDNTNVWFKLIGEFNAYNLLAAYGTAILIGEDSDKVLKCLSDVDPAPGRFEQIKSDTKVMAIVDYAHTPDALKNVLKTISAFRTGNEHVITVVGCGGERDKTKRPIMASIACELSNKVIFTMDNPRNEDPDEILRDMKEGVSASDKKKMLVIKNRTEAIKTACLMAEENDIILVAGKGHEKYQDIAGVKHPFDDKEILKEMLDLMAN